MIIKNRFVRDTLGDSNLFYAILIILVCMAVTFRHVYVFAGIAIVLLLAHAKAKSDNFNIEQNIIEVGNLFNSILDSYKKDAGKMDDELVDLYEANILSIGNKIKDLDEYNYYSPNYISLKTAFAISSSHILFNANCFRLNRAISDKIKEINNM